CRGWPSGRHPVRATLPFLSPKGRLSAEGSAAADHGGSADWAGGKRRASDSRIVAGVQNGANRRVGAAAHQETCLTFEPKNLSTFVVRPLRIGSSSRLHHPTSSWTFARPKPLSL